MVVDGSQFQKRVNLFVTELHKRTYPSTSWLAKASGCSNSTAKRAIDRMRDEFGIPVAYDESEKGFYLTDPKYQFQAIPAGKDELTALFLLRDLAGIVGAKDLAEKADAVWHRVLASSPTLTADLSSLSRHFSSDATVVSDLADQGVLKFVQAASAGENVEVKYKSPWKHDEPKAYRGRILKVHFSDGSLYLLFCEQSGRTVTLNVSFVKSFAVIEENLVFAKSEEDSASNWLAGFGIWAGEELEEVEVVIRPPAAEYYAAQQWQDSGIDSFTKEGNLVRRFPAILSPELVRRLLSLGKYLVSVKPQRLSDMLKEHVKSLASAVD